MARIAYVNGRYVRQDSAAVNIQDRGYQFADGIYEVCLYIGGGLWDLDGHLARMERSLDELRIERPMGRAALEVVIAEVLRRNRLDLTEIAQLNFEAPDAARFPTLTLAREALRTGGAAPTILNAANEVAVERFLAGAIGFLGIAELVERTLEAVPARPLASLDDVRAADAEARRKAEELAPELAPGLASGI